MRKARKQSSIDAPSPFRSVINVLVINPPILIEKNYIDHPYFVNIGALQHAAVLSERECKVEVADAFSLRQSDAFRTEDERLMIGCTNKTLLSSIGGNNFDAIVVCLSVFHRPFMRHDFTAEFFKLLRVKYSDTPIIAADAYFGGMHYIEYDDDSFFSYYPEVNYLLRGETENKLLCLIETLTDASSFQSGELWGADEVDLNSLPYPLWDAVDTDGYLKFLARFFTSAGRNEAFTRFQRFLPLVTSRGCSFSCSFCYSGGRIARRAYSIEYIAKYLRLMKKKYGIVGVVVLDGLANAGEFDRFLELFDKLSLKVSFANGLRADLLRRNHIKALARLTPSLAVSAESASARVRNELLMKNLSLEAVEKAASWCHMENLPLEIHYMTGVPGESVAEANETLEHALLMSGKHGARPLIQLCVPLPGARMHDASAENSPWRKRISKGYFFCFHPEPRGGELGMPDDHLSRMIYLFEKRLECAATKKLIVNLTYECNNKCTICAVGGRPIMSAKFDDCARLLAEYYSRGVRLVDFDGGEPTLHPDILRIVETARGIGYEGVNITTNGRAMASREFASRILLSGVSGILISLYGQNRGVHEKITLAPGSFEETLQGIRHALRLKPDRVSFGVNTVLTSSNWRHIESLMEMLIGLGVECLNVQFPTPFGRATASHLPPMKASTERLASAVDKFRCKLDVKIINLPPCMMSGHEEAALADIEKYGRHMAFVDTPPENLGAYLAGKRVRKKQCMDCCYYIVCEGFYSFESIER